MDLLFGLNLSSPRAQVKLQKLDLEVTQEQDQEQVHSRSVQGCSCTRKSYQGSGLGCFANVADHGLYAAVTLRLIRQCHFCTIRFVKNE